MRSADAPITWRMGDLIDRTARNDGQFFLQGEDRKTARRCAKQGLYRVSPNGDFGALTDAGREWLANRNRHQGGGEP